MSRLLNPSSNCCTILSVSITIGRVPFAIVRLVTTHLNYWESVDSFFWAVFELHQQWQYCLNLNELAICYAIGYTTSLELQLAMCEHLHLILVRWVSLILFFSWRMVASYLLGLASVFTFLIQCVVLNLRMPFFHVAFYSQSP